MAKLLWEDRRIFMRDFADNVRITTKALVTTGVIKSIFDREASGGPTGFTGQEDFKPELLVNDDDLPAGMLNGATVEILDETGLNVVETFVVIDPKPDGTGFTTLILMQGP